MKRRTFKIKVQDEPCWFYCPLCGKPLASTDTSTRNLPLFSYYESYVSICEYCHHYFLLEQDKTTKEWKGVELSLEEYKLLYKLLNLHDKIWCFREKPYGRLRWTEGRILGHYVLDMVLLSNRDYNLTISNKWICGNLSSFVGLFN